MLNERVAANNLTNGGRHSINNIVLMPEDMRATANLTVKGTRYYKAALLLQRGSLMPGLIIRLEHQPNNPHDKNAVAVRVKRTGAILGHVSRELARKYATLVDDEKIIEASISSIEKKGEYININVRVVYEQSDEQLAEKHNSRLWRSSSAIPEESGVYAIRNIDSGRQYIGSSKNLKSRIRLHIRDLSRGCHANHALQSDFSQFGADHFEAKILVSGISPSSLDLVEADRISFLLNSGAALYNLTTDGQGRPTRGYTDSEPVSDRLAKQRTEEEQRKININSLKKRKAVSNAFNSKLDSLLNQTSFWAYFVATFACTLIVLVIVSPKINDGSLFIISGILAFVVSPFMRSHFQEKTKQSAQYKSLVKQRDEQLREIDNEHRKQMQDL